MTEISRDAALAMIASHGGAPERWPDAMRLPVLALAGADAEVAAALAQARALDAMLAAWVATPAPEAAIAVARIVALPQDGPDARTLRAFGWRPAALAASVAVVIAAGWLGKAHIGVDVPAKEIVAAPVSAGAAGGEADIAFSYVFTPTAAEEDLI